MKLLPPWQRQDRTDQVKSLLQGWWGARSLSGVRGGRQAVRGRVDRPFVVIGCEVAAEFRTEGQHVLLSKIHTLTHELAHRHKHTQAV